MSDNLSNINWYPGHMTKALRQMKEDIKLIDLIIEIIDARIPLSSRNPDIDELGKNKSRIVLLNKADLSDPKDNKEWIEYFKKKGVYALEIDARNKKTLRPINDLVKEACREKIEKDQKRGIINRPVRAMVVGIPNVGKSTFINSFAAKACTKTGNKPGVTKGKQWIRLNKDLEFLDTPGILWPKFESQKVGLNLALVGSINDEILHADELAYLLIGFLKENYVDTISQRYGIVLEENKSEIKILEEIAVKRNYVIKGGLPDIDKAASSLIDDLRSGRLGRITLEKSGER